MADDPRSPDAAIHAALGDLGRKLDTVAGAVAAIAGGHTDLLSHVAEAEARRAQDSLGVAHRLEALERQVLTLGQTGELPTDGAPSPVVERLERIEHQLSALPGAAPGVESTFVALADRLDALAEDAPERRAALAHLTEVAEATSARLMDLGRPVDADLAAAVGAIRAQLGSLADAHGAVAEELAALGPKVNELLDRHPDGLPLPPAAAPSDDPSPLQAQLAELATAAARQQQDLALSLDVIARVAEAVERLDARTEDRLASIRDAAMAPIADLEAVLSARTERTEARFDELSRTLRDLVPAAPAVDPGTPSPDAAVLDRLDELVDAVDALRTRPTDRGELAPLLERVEEVATAVQSLTWQLPEVGDDVTGRLTDHTDAALAGVLRLVDERLHALRATLVEASAGPAAAAPPMGGFEAGAVMGAAQAAWNRLEQRLDNEFDDLGRQLEALGSLVEGVIASNEDLAHRPVVTGEQFRKAASAVKDSVVSAGRSRRDRRGGPRGLGSG